MSIASRYVFQLRVLEKKANPAMSENSSRLPNLYQLLGVDPLEADRGKVITAIQKAQARLTAADQQPLNSDERARLQKVIALAEKYLLDTQRKAAYDHEWQSVYRAARSSVQVAARAAAPAAESARARAADLASAKRSVATVTTWDTSHLAKLLPQGDPHAAFDMAAFLRGTESRDPAAESDLRTLVGLLSGESDDGRPVQNAQSSDLQHGFTNSEPLDVASRNIGVVLPARGASPSALAGHAERMRKKKQRAVAAGGSLLLVAVGGVLLLGVYLYNQPLQRQSSAEALASAAKPTPRPSGLPQVNLAPMTKAEGDRKTAPTGSGLPQPGSGAPALEIQTAPLDPINALPTSPQPTSAQPNSPQPTSAPAMAESPAGTAPNPTATSATTSAPPSAETTTAPATSSEPSTTPGSTEPATSAANTDVKLTREDKEVWQKGMTEAKEAIASWQFDRADKRLVELKEKAKTALQREQLERLQTVSGFVKEFRKAMIDAIAGLGAAETFKIGSSTIASFVEGDETKITVRVSGDRRSYALKDVPVNMGVALANLKLDSAQASAVARRGAYILMHPKNSGMLKQGKQMLQEAAAAGAISQELAHFYEDDYSLSQLPN